MEIFKLIEDTPLDEIMGRWVSPFGFAMLAHFRFTNLRPKSGTIYKKWGIFPLASARFKRRIIDREDNGYTAIHEAELMANGYTDTAINGKCAFGKLMSADRVDVWITELTAYEIARRYAYDCQILRGQKGGGHKL